VNRNLARYVAVLPVLALAACSTPADVVADHDRAIEAQQGAIDQAQDAIREENREFVGRLNWSREWDTHWWGIPAGGWVAIFIVSGVFLTIALCVWAYFFNERRRLRQRREHEFKLEAEKTERQRVAAAEQAVKRGNCQVCGAAPLDERTLKELEGD